MSKLIRTIFAAVVIGATALGAPAIADPAANYIMSLGNPQPYDPMLNGSGPIGTLLRGPGGKLWGVTWRGGSSVFGAGVIYCLIPIPTV